MEQIKSQTPALEDGLGIHGEYEIYARQVGEEEWKLVRKGNNICVNLGRNLARDNLFGTQAFYTNWGAVSDNTSTPVAADTSLGGNEKRNSMQASYPDIATNYQATCKIYFEATDWALASPSAMATCSKAGLYYKAAGSFLFCAAKFNAITVNATTELLVQWIVQFADI